MQIHKSNKQINRNYGLSLVELMVAMTISAILMLGLTQIFKANKESYNVQDENTRMQENGRFAFNLLMTDIRRAGYFGGNANISDITGTESISTPAQDCLTSDNSWGRMLERPIYGLNDTNNDTTTGDNYTGCIPDSDYLRGDILVTRYTKGESVTAATLAQASNANRLYIRSSLFVGRLFKATDEADTNNEVLETPNAVHELASNAYYVGPSGRNCRFKDAANKDIPIPALFREVLDNNGLPVKEEVSSGIEHIQFQYGVDSNGDFSVNRYYNANSLSNDTSVSPNWTEVVTVRLWVLVRADCPSSKYTNTNTYTMGDVSYTPNDNFKRQLYHTTVSTRN